MKRFIYIGMIALAVVFGYGMGSATSTSAGGGFSRPSFPLIFEAEGTRFEVYLGGTHFYVAKNSPEESYNNHMGPACPGDANTMAFIGGGTAENWTRLSEGANDWWFRSDIAEDLEISFGSFWALNKPEAFDKSQKPHAAGENFGVSAVATGVWSCELR